jgi:2-polyprenyl-6-methoxyphenol hydroxylase-like FAD-dependent oxidoreductase
VKIAIIGGGIGGLTTALALRHFGFEAEVFEQAPELLDVGAAIAMWPNALRVLLKLGVGEKVIAHAGVIERIRWQHRSGKSLNQTRLPTKAVPAVALHRADLQNVLLQALPGNSIHLGHDFTGCQHEHDAIRINFTSQTPVHCDVVIGADGLHSQLRDQLVGDKAPSYRGYMVWRGIAGRAPKGLDRATAIEIHGRGQRFGIGPVGNGRVGWWASANEKHPGRRAAATEKETLLKLFGDWGAPVCELISATPTEAILRNQALDRASTQSWGLGPMTLLGDAIHPTTPNLGQGGCLAVEDAAVLARCLAKENNPAQAFRAYEKCRYFRTAAIADGSRLYGNIGQWESRLGSWARGVMLSIVTEVVTRQLLELVFDYDAFTVRI